MAHLSHQEVEHVAQLAKLELSDQEKSLFAEQLTHILSYVDQLQKVPTEGIPPTASVVDQELYLREDIPQEGVTQEEALRNAPQQEEGFFVVPQIIEKSS